MSAVYYTTQVLFPFRGFLNRQQVLLLLLHSSWNFSYYCLQCRIKQQQCLDDAGPVCVCVNNWFHALSAESLGACAADGHRAQQFQRKENIRRRRSWLVGCCWHRSPTSSSAHAPQHSRSLYIVSFVSLGNSLFWFYSMAKMDEKPSAAASKLLFCCALRRLLLSHENGIVV